MNFIKRVQSRFLKINLTQEKIILLIQIAILLLLSGIYIILGVFPSIEMILAFTITIFIWNTKQRALLKDLLPLFLLLIIYQSMRGFADNLALTDIHVTDLIGAEKILFNGWIPAFVIQQIIPSIPYHLVIIKLANLFYMSHFVTPIVVAIVIWKIRKNVYWPYILGLLLLTYSAFLTYIFFPAAPPWWATKYGYLVDQPVSLSAFVYPTVVEFFGPNPVAAIPSLHMAYPTYLAIYLIFVWRKKVILILLFPFLVGLSTLILGHHYVVDLIVGIIYAGIAFFVAKIFSSKTQTKFNANNKEGLTNKE